MSEKVKGNCPMGCGETLFLGSGGYVTCALDVCPRPNAASDILADGEAHHVVMLGDAEFIVRHPLHERLDDKLLTCSLDAWLIALSGPPFLSGKYRVLTSGDIDPASWLRAAWQVIE